MTTDLMYFNDPKYGQGRRFGNFARHFQQGYFSAHGLRGSRREAKGGGLLTRSIARAESVTTPSPVPSLRLKDQNGPEGQPLRFGTNYCGSSQSPVPVSPKRIASAGTRRGHNNICRRPSQAPSSYTVTGTCSHRYSHCCPSWDV